MTLVRVLSQLGQFFGERRMPWYFWPLPAGIGCRLNGEPACLEVKTPAKPVRGETTRTFLRGEPRFGITEASTSRVTHCNLFLLSERSEARFRFCGPRYHRCLKAAFQILPEQSV